MESGEPGYNEYWLGEIKAPDGYELQAEPVQVVVDQLTNQVSVTNVKHNVGFQLPMTGGTGTLVFIIVGLAIIGVATVVLVRSHRRSRQLA